MTTPRTTSGPTRRRSLPPFAAATGVLALALLAAGCGGSADPDPSSSSASTTASDPNAPWADVEDRCNIPSAAKLATFDAPGGVLTGATVGEGDVAAVYLHQTGPSGMCGWVPFASWAAESGVRGVLLDLCGYGPSRCDDALRHDPEAQVAAGVTAAREAGATTVVVVGASMGASIALGVGEAAGADAVLGLSGPAEWEDVPDAVSAGRATTVPLLLAGDPGDGDISVAALREAVEVSPSAHKRFVQTGSGHGYTLLNVAPGNAPEWTPFAETVLADLKDPSAW